MKDLPIELIDVVAENISSTSDLLAFRSVNSTCHYLVTPHVFRKIRIHNSVQSAQNCLSTLSVLSLAAHVREVVYDPRDCAQISLLPFGAQGSCDELEIAELEDALIETFSSLSGFKNLERVVLNFWPSFRSQLGMEVHENAFWFTNRQITVLHAVHHALKLSRIRSLALNNVILMSPGCYDFISSMKDSPLCHFSMSIVANAELGTWSSSKAINGPLGSLLPPSNTNLKSLVLRSPQGLYHSLKTQLGKYHYPALDTLVLENIVFDPTSDHDGIEDFIVRHKASLRRLEFYSCSSYVPSTTIPVRRWSTIWERLEQELTSLTEIVISGTGASYTLLDPAGGYIPHPSILDEQAQEDVEHCLLFSEHVNLRPVIADGRL